MAGERKQEPVSIKHEGQHLFRHRAERVRFDDDVEFCLVSDNVKDALIELCKANIWEKLSCTIPASTTTECDSIALTSFHGLKYIFSIYNEAEDVHRTLEMVVSRKGAADIRDTVNSKVGDSIQASFDMTVAGADAKLRITNSESYDLTLSVARLRLGD